MTECKKGRSNRTGVPTLRIIERLRPTYPGVGVGSYGATWGGWVKRERASKIVGLSHWICTAIVGACRAIPSSGRSAMVYSKVPGLRGICALFWHEKDIENQSIAFDTPTSLSARRCTAPQSASCHCAYEEGRPKLDCKVPDPLELFTQFIQTSLNTVSLNGLQ